MSFCFHDFNHSEEHACLAQLIVKNFSQNRNDTLSTLRNKPGAKNLLIASTKL